VGPGDNAVIISPAYAIYANGVTMCGAEPRLVPLVRSDAGFSLDADRVRRAVNGDTRMLIVNSPSNPTGWMLSDEEQRALGALADEFDLRILADEVYERLTYDAPIAPSFARVLESQERLVVANSFSKTYCMTGWRLGWAQSSPALIRAMATGVEFMTSNASAPVQQAGIVALRDGEAHVADLRAHLAARRTQVVESLSAIDGVRVHPPSGGIFAFFTVEGVTDSASFALDLLRQTGVALAPGSAFGPGGESHLRLCFASSEATIAESLVRLRGALRRSS
jgi:aspartate/methionine/tyrosine aminotransferase